jgi:hypothetical protein
MRMNFLRSIACAALAAGIFGCSDGLDEGSIQIPVPRNSDDFGKFGHKELDLVLWLGKNVDIVKERDPYTIACSPCVRDDPPNSVYKPCNPMPCPNNDETNAAFDKGILIVRGMFEAQKRGDRIEFVIPPRT